MKYELLGYKLLGATVPKTVSVHGAQLLYKASPWPPAWHYYALVRGTLRRDTVVTTKEQP